MTKTLGRDKNIKILRSPKIVPKQFRPFKYKMAATPNIRLTWGRPAPALQEILTGFVHGEKASDLEERFARALDFFGLDYIFQYEVVTAYSLPDESRRIDFLVFDAGIGVPIEIGSSFVHAATSEKNAQLQRDAIINPILILLGMSPLSEESRVPWDRPRSFEDAKDIVSKMFIGA